MRRFMARSVTIIALLLAGCASEGSTELKKGWEFLLANNYPAARDVYESMLIEYPENPYAHLNLGVVYQNLGNTDLARQHYEAAIAHGGDAEVTRVVQEGDVVSTVTTVADKGRENLQTLTN